MIIFNKDEQVTNNIEERDMLDRDELIKVIKNTLMVNIKTDDNLKVTRLGPKVTDKKDLL